MIQDTSLEAYKRVLNNLTERQRTIYEAFKHLKKATDKEIQEYLGFEERNGVSPRRFELVNDHGLLKDAGVSRGGGIVWELVSEENYGVFKPSTCLSDIELQNVLKKISKANSFQKQMIIESASNAL